MPRSPSPQLRANSGPRRGRTHRAPSVIKTAPSVTPVAVRPLAFHAAPRPRPTGPPLARPRTRAPAGADRPLLRGGPRLARAAGGAGRPGTTGDRGRLRRPGTAGACGACGGRPPRRSGSRRPRRMPCRADRAGHRPGGAERRPVEDVGTAGARQRRRGARAARLAGVGRYRPGPRRPRCGAERPGSGTAPVARTRHAGGRRVAAAPGRVRGGRCGGHLDEESDGGASRSARPAPSGLPALRLCGGAGGIGTTEIGTGGSGGDAPDLVRLVDAAAAECHRIRLARGLARGIAAGANPQPLAFS